MTKKEFLKLYKGKGVWCKTEELAKEFLELADGFGFKGINGLKLTSMDYFYKEKEETCYTVFDFYGISFSYKSFCERCNRKIVEFKSLKQPQVTFDPPKTILTLNGKEFVSIAKDEPFDKEKGVLMCLAKANGFDYDKVSELVASAKKQTPKLTEAERVILENLLKEWKWIIRNEDDCICIFKEKPYKSSYFWEDYKDYLSIQEFNHLFQFIKWSDEEPYEIEKLLEEK